MTSPIGPGTDAGLDWPEAGRTVRLLRWLTVFYAVGSMILAALMTVRLPGGTGLRASGLGGIALGGLLVPLAGLAATWPVMAARRGRLRHGPRWGRLWWGRREGAEQLSWIARRPQGIIVPVFGLCAMAAVCWGRPAGAADAQVVLGVAAFILSFPLLVAERIIAGVPRSRLPEGPALQALLLVPVLLIPLAGLALLVGGWWVRPVLGGIGVMISMVAGELVLRGLANWFLPRPEADRVRASVESVSALFLQTLLLRPARIAPGGLATPLRTHFGIDFARSWTLRYARAAALPMLGVLAVVGWGLTGISLIELDRRGVYERFGAPAAVWAPGAHVGLPWPLGQVRRVELGVVHTAPVGGELGGEDRGLAEDAAPASADRLWDRVHPTEVSTLIASQEASGTQGFQVVSVDVRVLYRVGLDDGAAMRAAYRVAAPEALVRAEAGRLLTQLFAGETLAGALAENRTTQAERLRGLLQKELDRSEAGLEVMGVTIEAIHPPLGAAEAYHNVQAAEIVANTAIATERGRAWAAAAAARQNANDLVMAAQASAAETVGGAKATLRGFQADHEAAAAGRTVFLLERYFANLANGLAKSPLVIVDHRLAGADAPVIDLRSFAAPTARPADDD